MGNIINKIEYVFNIHDKINKCLGIKDKKTDNINTTKEINTMEKEFNDYDIIEKNEIYPYTFSKQNK
jgi:hypothetical protein